MQIGKLALGVILACCAALSVQAQTAAPRLHEVMLPGTGYFPQWLGAVREGDTVRFGNYSFQTITIVGRDADWVAPAIPHGGHVDIPITSGMSLEYFTAYGTCAGLAYCNETNLAIAYGTYEEAIGSGTIELPTD
jgi:hypothetical protein